jgi:hypothetical protein
MAFDFPAILAGIQVFFWLFFVAMLGLVAYLMAKYGRDTSHTMTGTRDRAHPGEPRQASGERQRDQAA